MDPVSESVPFSSIRVFLMMDNRLLREALIRLLRKRTDLVVVGDDGPADATASPALETQFDVLLIDSFQTTWPAAKIARQTRGQAAYKAVLIGMEPDEELFMAAVRTGRGGRLSTSALCHPLPLRCSYDRRDVSQARGLKTRSYFAPAAISHSRRQRAYK